MGPSAQHRQRGQALVDLGRHDAAVAEFRRAVALTPDDAEAWADLSWGLRAAGQAADAVTAAERAVTLAPDLAAAHTARARALLADDRPVAEALTSVREALYRAPSSSSAHHAAAVAYLAAMDLTAARQHAQAVLQLGSDPVWGLCLLAEVSRADHDWPTARALLLRALGLNRHTQVVMRALRAVAASAGDYGDAVEWARRAAAQRPDRQAAEGVAQMMMNALRREVDPRAERAAPLLREALESAGAHPPFVRSMVEAVEAASLGFRQDGPDPVASVDAVIDALERAAAADPEAEVGEPVSDAPAPSDTSGDSGLARRLHLIAWLGGAGFRRQLVDQWRLDAAHAHINRMHLIRSRHSVDRALDITTAVLAEPGAGAFARARAHLIRSWAWTSGDLPTVERTRRTLEELSAGLAQADRAGERGIAMSIRVFLGAAMTYADPLTGPSPDDAIHHLTATLATAQMAGYADAVGKTRRHLASAHHLRLVTSGAAQDATLCLEYVDAAAGQLRDHRADYALVELLALRPLTWAAHPAMADDLRAAHALDALDDLEALLRHSTLNKVRARLAATRADVFLALAPSQVRVDELVEALHRIDAASEAMSSTDNRRLSEELLRRSAYLAVELRRRGHPGPEDWRQRLEAMERVTGVADLESLCPPDRITEHLSAARALQCHGGVLAGSSATHRSRWHAHQALEMASARRYARLEGEARRCLDAG